MKKILLLLLSLFLGLSSQAQEDSLQANRYVMRATLYGAGLQIYWTPIFHRWNIPDPKFVSCVKYAHDQTDEWQRVCSSLFQANLSLTENKAETSNEMAGMVNWNYALHYQFRLTENLKILAGPMLDLNGGFHL